MTVEADDDQEVESVEDEEPEAAPSMPVILCAGDVAIPDADFLARDSGVQGVIAVRVTDNLDVEYLDGESRLWVSASVPAGPQRNRH